MNISFINQNKGNLSLQLPPNMTVKEMINKYCVKVEENINDFGKSIFLSYNNARLDTNSQSMIGNLFKGYDTVYVAYSADESVVEENNEQMKKIRKNQHKSMNEKKENKEEGKKQKIKDTLEDMARLGSIENQTLHRLFKKTSELFISIDECLNSKDEQFFILGIMAKYLENLGIKPFIEKADVTDDEEEQKDANTLLQFICNGYILKKKYELIFRISKGRCLQLRENENEREKFHEAVKNEISNEYKISPDNIIVTNFLKNRNYYTLLVVFKNNFNTSLTKDQLTNLFSKKKFDLKHFSEVSELPILESIRLNRSMLDKRGNNKDDNNWGYDETRGGENYYPPEGWHRYGLRVYDKYDNKDNDWLSYDNRDGEWCIAYSGLSGFTKKYNQYNENDNDSKNPGKKVGTGVITWQNPEFMYNNTEIINVNGINYKMGLMLRVNPDKIRVPFSNKNVWIVNGIPDEIRPYGILLKKLKA